MLNERAIHVINVCSFITMRVKTVIIQYVQEMTVELQVIKYCVFVIKQWYHRLHQFSAKLEKKNQFSIFQIIQCKITLHLICSIIN